MNGEKRIELTKKESFFEKPEDMQNRLYELTDKKDYGIIAPPTNPYVAMNELIGFFLGPGWYSMNPVSSEQVYTEALYEIERIYQHSITRMGNYIDPIK